MVQAAHKVGAKVTGSAAAAMPQMFGIRYQSLKLDAVLAGLLMLFIDHAACEDAVPRPKDWRIPQAFVLSLSTSTTGGMAAEPTHSYALLDQSEEDNLHSKRHLQVEERAFVRATKNLLSKDTLLQVRPKQLPSPPPEGEEQPKQKDEDETFKRQKFREDVLLDFAAFDSSLVRMQLLQSSNQRERERYASEKAKIVETANAMKENTIALRSQLAQAQEVLEQRKGYDKLATELIPKTLKSRAETRSEIEKLEKEIEDLRQESSELDSVWAGRREAFDRVVVEGQNAVKLIKGIKDEPEPDKDEQMEDGGDGEKEGKDDRSRMGTPAPGDATPMPGCSTPILRGATPMLESGEIIGTSSPRPANKFLDVDDVTRSSSRVGTPRMEAKDPAGDVEMGEEAELEPQPKATTGLEAKDDQVVTPAALIGAEGEQMDES